MVGGAIRWGGAGGLLTLWLGGRSLAGAPGDRTGLLVVVGVVAAVLAAAGALLAWLEWRRQGWRLTDRFVVARRGLFTRRTWILPRAKIQSVHLHAGPILRRYGLARVVVWVAGSSVGLPIVRAADAATLFTALAQRPVEAGVPGIEVVYTAGREAPP
jgi:membrane protein YdbS with pleckstrin-like domain